MTYNVFGEVLNLAQSINSTSSIQCMGMAIPFELCLHIHDFGLVFINS